LADLIHDAVQYRAFRRAFDRQPEEISQFIDVDVALQCAARPEVRCDALLSGQFDQLWNVVATAVAAFIPATAMSSSPLHDRSAQLRYEVHQIGEQLVQLRSNNFGPHVVTSMFLDTTVCYNRLKSLNSFSVNPLNFNSCAHILNDE
jgi:hypothetical protein